MFDDLKVSSFLADRAIRRGNKGTIVMTIVILAIVFVNMLFLPAILNGFLQHFNEKNINYYSGHMVIYPRENEPFIENASEVRGRINSIPGVLGTTRREGTGVIITYRDRVLSKGITAIDPGNEKTVTKIDTAIVDGQFLEEDDTGEILLGYYLAGDKNVDEELEMFPSLRGVPVGDSVQVTYNNGVTKSYRVKGIIRSKDQNIDNNAYITVGELDSVLGQQDRASSINIRLSSSIPVDEFKTSLMKYGIQYKIRTWLEDAAAARDYMRSFDIISVISTIAGLIIAVIVMFVVIYINTVNKRKQIGILKAIGVDQQIIINSYVIQVIFFVICGIILGLLLVSGIIAYMTVNPMEFPDGDVSPVLDLFSVVQSAIILFVASLIAGYIPAWNTAKQGILSAMRG
jgi:putative ABC transport system permease protein